MEDVTIDGLNEHGFRQLIEAMLRHGEADSAARKLRTLIEPYAGDGKILPSRFLTVTSSEIRLGGWDQLGQRIGEIDRPDHHVSAVSVALAAPEGVDLEPDATGSLKPFVETSYFSDEAYPFSEAARTDLLDGYSSYGCEWQGDCEETDSILSVQGIDDLYGAVARLEARLMASDEPDVEEIRAGSLGACYLSVLMHQAVRDTIRKSGLPRTMCVMAGSNGVYPFFDAPVMSSEECLNNGIIEPVTGFSPPVPIDDEEQSTSEMVEAPVEHASLLSVGGSMRKKKPVLVLDPDDGEAKDNLDWLMAAQLKAEAGRPARADAWDVAAQLSAVTRAVPVVEDDIFEDPASFIEPFEPQATETALVPEPDFEEPHSGEPWHEDHVPHEFTPEDRAPEALPPAQDEPVAEQGEDLVHIPFTEDRQATFEDTFDAGEPAQVDHPVAFDEPAFENEALAPIHDFAAEPFAGDEPAEAPEAENRPADMPFAEVPFEAAEVADLAEVHDEIAVEPEEPQAEAPPPVHRGHALRARVASAPEPLPEPVTGLAAFFGWLGNLWNRFVS